MKSKFTVTCANGSLDPVILDLKVISFSDGTIQCQIPDHEKSNLYNTIIVDANIVDSDGIIALSQIKDIIDHYIMPDDAILSLKYTPYARYDRRMVDGDSFSLSVFAKMINAMEFERVILADPHSDVSMNEIKNSVMSRAHLEGIDLTKYDYFVSPDGGAVERVLVYAVRHNIPFLQATKKRDVNTGYTVFDRIILSPGQVIKPNSTVLIIDDICDGGATFVNLAEKLKSDYDMKCVDLFVSHGIFSKGKDLKYIDNLFCDNDLHSLIYGN